MILQALKEYYDRKASDPDSGIAPLGWEWKEAYYEVCIDHDGNLINMRSTVADRDGKKVAKRFLVPRSIGRSGSKSFTTTFFLWDHRGYILGYPSTDVKSVNQHRTWCQNVEGLRNRFPDVMKIRAIDEFNKKLANIDVTTDDRFKECLKDQINRNFVFNVDGEMIFLDQAVKTAYEKTLTPTPGLMTGICLVTGKTSEIVRTHSPTPISKDSKFFISFQKNSGYDSYGKEQALNAPVSADAEFAYTTALNTLLGKDSRQKVRIGDATVIFWSGRFSKLEEDMFSIFGDVDTLDNPDAYVGAVEQLLKSVKTGAYHEEGDSNSFYVLGLSPSSVRISVRFWHQGTVEDMSGKFASWFEDLKIAHGDSFKEHLAMFRLLRAIAPLGKSENIPPNLAGNVMHAILEGLPLPETLLQAALRRIKAETGDVSYARAKLIKACLNRKFRFSNSTEKEITIMLDKGNTNIGYRLGRLFAVLERIQEAANDFKPLNSTIRDKYYSAASSTPAAVFGTLMRLKNHHLAKLVNPKSKVFFEGLIGEITFNDTNSIGIARFPAHLKLDDQGQFAIGYYHQRQDFFAKKESTQNQEHA